MPTVELLHRNRFVALEGADATPIAANAWSVRIPLTEAVRRLVRRADDPEAWDGSVFSIDGRETAPAVGTGTGPAGITVTVLVL